MKADIKKLRAQLLASGKQTVTLSFADSLDLASAAQAAVAAGQDYIELSGYASSLAKNDRGFKIAAVAWTKPSAFERISKNPMVLFNHCCDLPIGQITAYEARSDGLWVTLRLRYNAVLETQEKLGDLVSDGTLRAMSIRLDIIEYEVVEMATGIELIVTELCVAEISLVSVPSDPDALGEAGDEYTLSLSKIYKSASIPDELKEEGTMWKLLAKEYGMSDDATEDQVMAEYKRRQTLGSTAIIGLGLDPKTFTADQLTAALAARDPKLLAKSNAQLLVSEAINLKKIAMNDEDTKKWALAYAEKDADGFKEWMALQKEIATPNTRPVTGAGVLLGGKPDEGGPAHITTEDREICLAFGIFPTVEKMDEMAETSPNVALSWVLGQNFPATVEDKKVLLARKRIDTACGIVR